MILLSSSVIIPGSVSSEGSEAEFSVANDYVDHGPVRIDSNADFFPDEMNSTIESVIAGNGTADDPWIIEGWNIDARGHGTGIS